jgi:hypothetical protein
MAFALQTRYAVIQTHVMRLPTKSPPLTRLPLAAAAFLLLFALPGCSALRRERPLPDTSRDVEIAQAVTARLGAEPALVSAAIRVEASGGRVLLFGSVKGLRQWNCAIRNAELVDGVRSVVDYLVIERGPREVGCGAPRGSE